MINRPAHSTGRRAGLALALCVVMGLWAAVPAPAEEPAVDEYSIDLPGEGPSGVSGDALGAGDAPKLPPGQPGVVGESSPPESSLSSLGGALGAVPLAAIAGVGALGLLLLAARHRSQREP